MASQSAAIQQFGRAYSLIVANASGEAIDLSDSNFEPASTALRFKFQIEANDVETPNTARIRVYNPSSETVKLVIGEYNSVILNAGYPGNVAQIFKGTIKQYVTGKERNVDNFLEIRAADGDLAYNFGIVNTSIKSGSTPNQRLNALVGAMSDAEAQAQSAIVNGAQQQQISVDPAASQYLSGTGGILPRGKVMFGLARSFMADLSDTAVARWSIQNGVVTVIPLDGYLSATPIQINSATGMIGVPEATEQGITITCLLNPLMRIGRPVQLNNADVTATTIKEQFFPSYTDYNLIATVGSATDGLYRPVVIEHVGDSRGQEWYTKLICLLIDPSNPSAPVAPYCLPGN
jgi:hypothetical protein